MARYEKNFIYVAAVLSLVFVVHTAPPGISNLNKFVTYVNRGFASIFNHLQALKTSNQVSTLKLKRLNSSIQSLKLLEPECPNGWIKHAGRCFQFQDCTTPCTAQHANTQCSAVGAYLASSLSLADDIFFLTHMSTKHWFFLSGTDNKKEGEWFWADGTPIKSGYINWAKGQPSGGNREDCMIVIVPLKQWYDFSCSTAYKSSSGHVCEKRLRYGS